MNFAAIPIYVSHEQNFLDSILTAPEVRTHYQISASVRPTDPLQAHTHIQKQQKNILNLNFMLWNSSVMHDAYDENIIIISYNNV